MPVTAASAFSVVPEDSSSRFLPTYTLIPQDNRDPACDLSHDIPV